MQLTLLSLVNFKKLALANKMARKKNILLTDKAFLTKSTQILEQKKNKNIVLGWFRKFVLQSMNKLRHKLCNFDKLQFFHPKTFEFLNYK